MISRVFIRLSMGRGSPDVLYTNMGGRGKRVGVEKHNTGTSQGEIQDEGARQT